MDIFTFIKTLDYLKKPVLSSLNEGIGDKKYYDYINQLNQTHIDLRGLRLSQIETALYEAIYLFDFLSTVKKEFSFQYYFYSGIQTVTSLYNDYENLDEFKGDSIKRDIFFAQFQYFIHKYLLFYFHKKDSSTHKGMSLSIRTRNCVLYYQSHQEQMKINMTQSHPNIINYLDDPFKIKDDSLESF